jgi:dTDP-4-dehydrorhamnose reductase
LNVLVTGAAGMLGRAVMDRFKGAAVGVDLADGDLADPVAVNRIFSEHTPSWVVHCAAFTDVDGAERARETAHAANATATANVAYACQLSQAGLTYVSTDYVFAGTAEAGYLEADAPAPVNHYGATKAAGEAVVETLTTPWQIVRTSWLFGDAPRNFVLTIRRLLAERETLRVVDDQRGSPTYADDLAAVLHCLVGSGARGIFHVTNAGVCTWFEFARAIARGLGADPARVEPCASDAFPTPAPRPACSVLIDTRLTGVGCAPAPPWPDALVRYLGRLADA